jgi:hypothetical protein
MFSMSDAAQPPRAFQNGCREISSAGGAMTIESINYNLALFI